MHGEHASACTHEARRACSDPCSSLSFSRSPLPYPARAHSPAGPPARLVREETRAQAHLGRGETPKGGGIKIYYHTAGAQPRHHHIRRPRPKRHGHVRRHLSLEERHVVDVLQLHRQGQRQRRARRRCAARREHLCVCARTSLMLHTCPMTHWQCNMNMTPLVCSIHDAPTHPRREIPPALPCTHAHMYRRGSKDPLERRRGGARPHGSLDIVSNDVHEEQLCVDRRAAWCAAGLRHGGLEERLLQEPSRGRAHALSFSANGRQRLAPRPPLLAVPVRERVRRGGRGVESSLGQPEEARGGRVLVWWACWRLVCRRLVRRRAR